MIKTYIRIPGITGKLVWEGELPCLVENGKRIDTGGKSYRVISSVLKCEADHPHRVSQLVMVEPDKD